MAELSLSGVAIDAGGQRLASGIDLTVEAGRVCVVRGPSGSGKTTLLRAVAALIDVAAGAVALDGASPEALGYPVWRRRVGYVAQRPVLLEGTVRDNLARPFSFASVSGAFDEQRAARWLERIELPGRMADEARKLSVGQQQRVALVRALLLAPDVMLLDEPTSALDARAALAVEALLRERLEAGAAALLVTHDKEQMQRLSTESVDLEEYLGA